MLAGQPQPHPAGGQDVDAGAIAADGLDERRRADEDVLAIIEDE